MPSIFSQIISGEFPSHKVYEDVRTLAFLDIHPVAEGHVLVVPKSEVEFIWDLAPDDYAAVMETARKVALRLRDVTGKPYVSEAVIGVDVPHAHVQLIPFSRADELASLIESRDGEPDHEALARIAGRLRFS